MDDFSPEQVECAENGILDGINNSQTKIDPVIINETLSVADNILKKLGNIRPAISREHIEIADSRVY
jgi:hypothetical protein